MTNPELNAPAMSLEKAQETVATKTAPKITKESIEEAIAGTSYLFHDHLTIAVITMKNGFMHIGKAAPASPANFDPEVGKRYAFEDAFRGLWQFEGYVLCQKLYDAKQEGMAAADKPITAVAESPQQAQPEKATP